VTKRGGREGRAQEGPAGCGVDLDQLCGNWRGFTRAANCGARL